MHMLFLVSLCVVAVFGQYYYTGNDLTCGLPSLNNVCGSQSISIEFTGGLFVCFTGDFSEADLSTGTSTNDITNFQLGGDLSMFNDVGDLAMPGTLTDVTLVVRDDGSLRAFQGRSMSGNGSFRYVECEELCVSNTNSCLAALEFEPRLQQPQLRKRQTITTPISTGAFVGAASLNGDPHMTGARGQKFDLIGEANATYALFVAPQFQVSATLKNDHLKNHFVDKISISVGDAKVQFATKTQRNPLGYMANLNRMLAPHGGSARYMLNKYAIEVTVCGDHRVKIMQRKSVKSGGYLNFEIDVPGCHDDFDGILGQTYQCRYERAPDSFHYDASMEQKYRVKNIFSAFGKFDSKAPCFGPEHFRGKSILNGKIE